MSGTISGAVVNRFDTGKQCSLVVVHALAPGGRLDLPLVTDFDAKPTYHDITSNGLDGYTRTMHIPQNVPLSFSVDRTDSTIDAFCSAMWQSYYLSGFVAVGQVFHYVQEASGSQSTTQFMDVAFKVDDLGSWKKESAVSQKLTGTAMRYLRIT